MIIGVEPCKNLAKITKRKKYTIYDKYWNIKLSKKLKKNLEQLI